MNETRVPPLFDDDRQLVERVYASLSEGVRVLCRVVMPLKITPQRGASRFARLSKVRGLEQGFQLRLFAFVWGLFAAINAHAVVEPGAPMAQFFSSKDYGAGTINWAVTQDLRGFMYFANGQGALEFDGVTWTLVPLDSGGQARSITADRHGTVYVGGVGEFGYLTSDAKGKTVYRSLSKDLVGVDSKFSNVWTTHATSHGIYFVAHRKIFRWYLGHLTVIRNDKLNRGNLVGDTVYLFHFDGGISALDNGELRLLQNSDFISSDNTGRVSVLPYSETQLFIATTTRGCYLYDIENSTFSPFPTDVDKYLEHNKFYYGPVVTASGEYYLPTLNGGVAVIDRGGKLMRIINESQAFEINGNSTTAISTTSNLFLDRSANLWVASQEGLAHINLQQPWIVYDANREARSVLIDAIRHDGHLYVTSFKGIFFLPDYELTNENNEHRFLRLDTPKQQSFVLLKHKNILLASLQDKLYRIKGKEAQKLVTLQGDPVIMSMGATRALPDYIFLGKNSGGIDAVKIDIEDDRVAAQLITMDVPELDHHTIRGMVDEESGDLWVVSESDGLYKLSFDRGPRVYTTKSYGLDDGLPVLQNNYLATVDNEILLYNHKGIYQVESVTTDDGYRDVRFVPDMTRGQFFFDQNVAILGIAQYGKDIFVKTSESAGFLRKRDDGGYRWDTSAFAGVPHHGRSGNPSELMVYIEPDMTLWYPSNSALFRLKPGERREVGSSFSSAIRKVTVNNVEEIFNGNFPLHTYENSYTGIKEFSARQPVTSMPVFPYEMNSITLDFSAQDFANVSDIKFSYKLQGFDKHWSAWSLSSRKEYTNLDAGSYQFQVKAKNIYDQESMPSIYRFEILPPWYRNRWAYAIYTACLVALMFAFVRIYSWRLVRTQKILENLVRHRTGELQRSIRQLRGTQNLLTETSRQAGMAEVARSMLHNVGNALNGVLVSSSIMREKLADSSLFDKMSSALDMLGDYEKATPGYLTNDSKAKRIPHYLRMVTDKSRRNHAGICDQMVRLLDGVTSIEKIVDQQRDYTEALAVTQRIGAQELIERAIQVSDIVDDDNICIHWNVDDNLVVDLETHKVTFVLMHLLNNAKQAMETLSKDRERILSIDLEVDQQSTVVMTVADTGIGIAKDLQGKIYAHGYTTKPGAKGYGLHMCANAATEMNGHLTCHSNGDGQGAKFVLTLPQNATQETKVKPTVVAM